METLHKCGPAGGSGPQDPLCCLLLGSVRQFTVSQPTPALLSPVTSGSMLVGGRANINWTFEGDCSQGDIGGFEGE